MDVDPGEADFLDQCIDDAAEEAKIILRPDELKEVSFMLTKVRSLPHSITDSINSRYILDVCVRQTNPVFGAP